MRVLVTFALEAEFAPWRKMRRFRGVVRTALPLYGARFDGEEVFVGITGVGPEFSPAKLAALFAVEPDAVISTGLCGALKPGLGHGDIVAPEQVKFVKSGATVRPCAEYLKLAEASGARAVGSLITASHLVAARNEKRALAVFADAVDMESFKIMQIAESRGIRSLALRAVSDEADDEVPEYLAQVIRPDGTVRKMSLLARVAAHPSDLGRLVRLGQRSTAAAEKLARFLDEFVGRITRMGITVPGKADAVAV